MVILFPTTRAVLLALLSSLAVSAVPAIPAPRHPASLRRRWDPNQINSTMCLWYDIRAAVLRDTLYVDGGYLWDLPGMADGSYGQIVQDPNLSGLLYSINFTQPFNISQNTSTIFQTTPKAAGAANNQAPNFYSGTMFSNDNELYLYGGVLRDTDSQINPPADAVTGYERYQYGPVRTAWSVGFYNGQLPPNVTRYVTNGAGVNVPSENLGFYFSGMKRNDSGEIRTKGRPQYNATLAAPAMISIDMSTMRAEKWTNLTLPSNVLARAGSELAWVPVSQQGVLLAIGGVINPETAFLPLTAPQKVQSQAISPGFMQEISVFDVAAQKWYQQNTTGDVPGQLTQACSVVASAADGSSHNVYFYGGYDGLSATNSFSDDVYILSIPSFTWIKAYSGTSVHGRKGHRCAKIYPDQMIIVGGDTVDKTCLQGGLIQIFNLNTLKFQDQYDPKVWSQYKVPDVVTAKIGGTPDGAATASKPSTWSDSALGPLFAAQYSKTVPTYYPYNSVAPTPTDATRSTALPTPIASTGGSNGVPSWVAPVLGTVVGLIVLSAVVVCLLLYRRRKFLRMNPNSDAGTSVFNQRRILSWIPKAPTVSTSEDPSSSVSGYTGVPSEHLPNIVTTGPQEAASSEVHELPDSSHPAELPPNPAMSQISPAAGAGLRPGPYHQNMAGDESTTSSPTTPVGYARGHTRQVSSMSSGLPSPVLPTSPASEASPDDLPRTPVSPAENEQANPSGTEHGKKPEDPSIKPKGRESSFGEMLE
ncbi:MAG: hypothetical protein M1829_000443 [Trizodia sp. TS-e1964]|nr:MAG: hypothetical protein M1829_000443 [Trizodia sp. TS-e1964]